MRSYWLFSALIATSFIRITEQSLLVVTWQMLGGLWSMAESSMTEYAELIHLIQAAKLVIC